MAAGDWSFDEINSVWELDGVLTTNSETEGARLPGFAGLLVQSDQAAVIGEGGEWQLPLQDDIGIALENGGRLQLDGDLLVETDLDDPKFTVSAVVFGPALEEDPIEGVGLIESTNVLEGSGNISMIHETSVSGSEPALLVAGVVSDGSLDISDFDGSITALNDNSGGLPTTEAEESFSLPIFGEDFQLDLDKSAAALGLGALNLEALMSFDIFALFDSAPIIGELNQEISSTAISRSVIDLGDNEEAFIPDPIEGDGSDDVIDAAAGAIAVGVIGFVEDGITAGADISATATAGSTLAITGDAVPGQDAVSGNLAAALGFAGGTPIIADASISGLATSDSSTATSLDGSAYGLNLAAGVGFVGLADTISGETSISGSATSAASLASAGQSDAFGLNIALGVGGLGNVGSIDGGEEGDRVTISGEATSAQSTSIAENDYALSASAALAVGFGGFVDGGFAMVDSEIESLPIESSGPAINAADISAVATSDRAQVVGDYSGTALSLALGAGMIGETNGTINNSTITTTVTAGAADATVDEFASVDASALSLGVGLGYIGGTDGFTGGNSSVTVGVTSDSADADAEDNAFASSSALAIGVGGLDSLYLAFESLSELEFLFGGIPVDLVEGLPGLDMIEGDIVGPESSVGSLAGTIDVAATAADANAVLIRGFIDDPVEGELGGGGDAVASASADAFGVAGSTFGEVSADITATATAANANADTGEQFESNAYALSEAQAAGIAGALFAEMPEDDFSGSVTAVATAGEAVAESIEGYAEALATADALGIGQLAIDMSGSVTATATGGTAVAASSGEFSGGVADAGANAIAIVGDAGSRMLRDPIEGGPIMVEDLIQVGGSLTATATGGQAYVSSSSFGLSTDPVEGDILDSEPEGAVADANAVGIYGTLSANFDATLSGVAVGGSALYEETAGIRLDPIEGGGFPGGYGSADASATAVGIGARNLAVEAESVSGTINLTATGGDATVVTSDGFAIPQDPIEGGSLVIDGYSFGSDYDTPVVASAKAVAIDGDVRVDVLNSDIDVVAQGGNALSIMTPIFNDPVEGDILGGPGPVDASAFAAGIIGQSVDIGELSGSGGISASATGGLVEFRLLGLGDPIEGGEPELGFPEEIPGINSEVAEAGSAFAVGIMTYDSEFDFDVVEGFEAPSSLLDVVIGTKVYTFAENTDELGGSAYNAAVYAGQGSDYVELAQGADIIGDINLGGGENTLVVSGNTILEGDILSSSVEWVDNMLSINNGSGTIDFDIVSGLFTAVRTVNVSDLVESLEIAAEGGLSPILVQAAGVEPADPEITTSLLSISGEFADVNIAEGALMLPVFDPSVDLNNLAGTAYTIIDSEGVITDAGAIADGSLTPYNFSTNLIEGEGDQFQLVVEGLRVLDEEETPGNVQASEAVVAASQAVMLDLGKHSGTLRGLLRRNVSTASAGSLPQGPAGPSATEVAHAQRMQNGEWLGYTSVFGNLGEQEDEGGFAGYEYDTYGFTLGFEKLFGEQLIMGVAGTYATTNIDGNSGSGGGDSDLMAGAVYANWFTETWYFNGGMTYGQASTDVYRVGLTGAVPATGVFAGDYDSQMIGTWTEIGFTHRVDAMTYEPYARLTYISGDHDGYTESNPIAAPGFAQVVGDDDTDNFKSEIGLRIAREWMDDDGSSFTLEGKAGWEHEWADKRVEVDATYLGSRFQLQSGESDADALVLGLRAMWENGEGLGFSLEYEPTIAGNWYNHALTGTLQYNW